MKANTFIIGAQKAGTTSLYQYMAQHPDVYFSEVKEVTYFVDDEHYAKGLDWYHGFFNRYQTQKVIATSFVHMLVDAHAPQRLQEYNPDSKIIICLRDPVQRAHSAYHYAIKNGWESESTQFIDCLHRELDPQSMPMTRYHDRNYFVNGLYAQHIQRWQQYFPAKQFFFIQDQDLRNNAKDVLVRLFQFLEIDTDVEVDTSKEFNKAGKVRSKGLQKLILNKESKIKLWVRKTLPKSWRVWLLGNVVSQVEKLNRVDAANPQIEEDQYQQYFEKDLAQLKSLFGIDLHQAQEK